MRVYTCVDFDGHWPVGTSAVIVAGNRRAAKKILAQRLEVLGLKAQTNDFELERVDTRCPSVTILQDGDY